MGNDVKNETAAIALNEGAVTVEMARAGAEVQAAMQMARRFPRDLQEVHRRVEQLCTDRCLAEKAEWRYKRGGDMLQGPSIMLVSALANAFGNLRFGVAQLSREISGQGCEVRVFCIDLESNTEASMTFWASGDAYVGTATLKSPRDRYENMATQASRRLRQQILRCLPHSLVAEALIRCRKTRAAAMKNSPLQQDLEAFAQFGIVEGDLRSYVGKPTSEWTQATRDELLGILAALRDGVSQPGDYFPRFAKKLASRLKAPTPQEGLDEPTGIRFLKWDRGELGWEGKWSIDGEMEGTVVVADNGEVLESTPLEAPTVQLAEAVRWALRLDA